MLRLGAEESLESVMQAHYRYLDETDSFEPEMLVCVDITNQPDATDEREFYVGHYGPQDQNVRAIYSHNQNYRDQIVAVYALEVMD